MSLRPLGGYIDFPLNTLPEDPHLGLTYDYEFAGKPMGEQLELLIHSWVIDDPGNIYSRRATYIIPQINAIECITLHIRNHIISLGVEDMSCRRLMRDLEINKEKAISYESLSSGLSKK